MILQYIKLTPMINDLGLSSNARTILQILLSCSLLKGHAWPSISSIALQAGCSTRTVQTIIRDLDSKGIITIKERTDRNGKPKSHLYTPSAQLLDEYRKAILIENNKKDKSLKEQLKDADPESARVRAIAISAHVLALAGLLPKKTAYEDLENLIHIFDTSNAALKKSVESTKSEIDSSVFESIDEIIAGIR